MRSTNIQRYHVGATYLYWLQRDEGEYGDMIAVAVSDPAKDTRSTVKSAASIVAMILAIEALVADRSPSVA